MVDVVSRHEDETLRNRIESTNPINVPHDFRRSLISPFYHLIEIGGWRIHELVSERDARCLGSTGLTGHGAPIYTAVRPGPSLRIALDGSKAKLWLGGSPQTSLMGVQPH